MWDELLAIFLCALALWAFHAALMGDLRWRRHHFDADSLTAIVCVALAVAWTLAAMVGV